MQGTRTFTLGLSNNPELELLRAAQLRRPIGDPLGEIIGAICDAITADDHDKMANAWSEVERKAADLSRAASRTADAVSPVDPFPVDLRRWM